MLSVQFVSFVSFISFCSIFLLFHFFMIDTNEERLSILVIMCSDESNFCSTWNIDDEWAKMHNDVCVNSSDCLWQQQKVDLKNFLCCSLLEKLRIEFALENDILSKFQKQKKIWMQNFRLLKSSITCISRRFQRSHISLMSKYRVRSWSDC